MFLCYYHVTYVFQSESTLCICLNVNERLARNRRDIWSLSDCYGTLLNHLAKLTIWLAWLVSPYVHDAFVCMFLSCHVPISEWIHTLYLPECQRIPCLKQARYLKFKWLRTSSSLTLEANIECGFTLKCVLGMVRTYSQMHCTHKNLQLTSIIWSIWPNGWLLVY